MKTAVKMFSTGMVITLLAACGGGGNTAAVTTEVPVPVVPVVTYLGVSAGASHTLAIKSDGSLLSWGLNRNGQLGNGTTLDKLSPAQVGATTATLGSVISSGEFHSLALSSCATAGCVLWAWGSNDNGRLGDGTIVEKKSPTKITGTNWLEIAAGGFHSAAVKKDGTLWTWGRNDVGQLGLGIPVGAANLLGVINHDTKMVPTQVGTLKTWIHVSTGALHTLGMLQTGAIMRWGANDRGQLGLDLANAGIFSFDLPKNLLSGSGSDEQLFSSMSAGGDHSLAILNNGTLHSWGANGFGQLGNGTTIDGLRASQVGTENNWESVSAGGGHNDSGNDLPANGGHSLAVKTDGTLWAWGSNSFGQLGLGMTDDTALPTQVGKDTNWKKVSAGKLHSFAWKADGSLWGWGNNLYGQLGNGVAGTTAKDILVPTRLN